MLLEEIGADYELILVDRKSEQQKSLPYLKINPTGRIPTLIDDKLTVFESAAICLYLCEQHPHSNLIPDLSDPNRAAFHQWLFYLTSSVQPEFMLYFYPDKHSQSTSDHKSISAIHESRIMDMFALLDNELKDKNYLVGDSLSVCDLYLFMLCHWASGFIKPPLSFKYLTEYLKKLATRPSIQKVCVAEGTSLNIYS